MVPEEEAPSSMRSPTSRVRSVWLVAGGKMSLRQEERSGREAESRSQQWESEGVKRGEGGRVAEGWGNKWAGLEMGVMGQERVVRGDTGTSRWASGLYWSCLRPLLSP